MTWNKEKIIARLDDVYKRIGTVQDEIILLSLKSDYELLLDIIKTVDKKTYNIYREMIPVLSHDSDNLDIFRLDSFQACFNRRKTILKILERYKQTGFDYNTKFTLQSIPEEEYVDMVLAFFKEYDNDHYELLLKCLDDYVMLTNRRPYCENVAGKCYSLHNFEEPYILAYKPRSTNISTLPHEIAHAYEFSLMEEYFQRLYWTQSQFSESYPKFIELLFLYKNLDSKYHQLFLNRLIIIFNDLSAMIEDYQHILLTSPLFDSHTGEIISNGGEVMHKKTFDLIISNFMAIYMFDIYKNNRNDFNQFMFEYRLQMGLSDNSIWELISGIDMGRALEAEVNSLKRILIQK